MKNRIACSFVLWLFTTALLGQATFSYSVQLEPQTIEGLGGVHSYAYGQKDGKWVIIGGRLDGIHARQSFTAFPASRNNNTIWVVDPKTSEVWTALVDGLSTSLKEQLQATNFPFYQDGDELIIVGGYAYSETEGDHITFPYLTTVNLPGLISNVINGENIDDNFQQIEDDIFAVSGGNLGKIGDEFYLVGGHRFDGSYESNSAPRYKQTYTDGIRKFTLDTQEKNLSFDNYTLISDPVHLHRRDYNLLPQIYPNGELGYTLFSGVFQLNDDLPFLYPVDITGKEYAPRSSFNQYLSNYHSAHVALFDENENSIHNLFFGGISQYYYVGSVRIADGDIPFVKTISRVSRDADGNLEEVRLPIEMPDYLGTNAELIIDESLLQIAPGIVNISGLDADTTVLGYIFGGIKAKGRNPFYFNDSESTSAATTLYRVSIIKSETTPIREAILPGYQS